MPSHNVDPIEPSILFRIGALLKLIGPPLALGAVILTFGVTIKHCAEEGKQAGERHAEQVAACDMWRYQVAQTSGHPPDSLIAERPAGCSPFSEEPGHGVTIPEPPVTTPAPAPTPRERTRNEYGSNRSAARYGRY